MGIPADVKALEDAIEGDLGRQLETTVQWLRYVADDLEQAHELIYGSIRRAQSAGPITGGTKSDPTGSVAIEAADRESNRRVKRLAARATRQAREAEKPLRRATSTIAKVLDPARDDQPPPLSQLRYSAGGPKGRRDSSSPS